MNFKYHELEMIDLNPDKYTFSTARINDPYGRIRNEKGRKPKDQPPCLDTVEPKYRVKKGQRIYPATQSRSNKYIENLQEGDIH